MTIKITLYCPDCQSAKIKKNGKKLCKSCGRQFIGDHALTYKGCHSSIIQKILLMLVIGIGIRDISVIESVSIKKVLSVLVNSNRIITPKQQHYENLADLCLSQGDRREGIEGNNCRLRHRIRRAYRKTCCFSNKLFNHLKAFELAFYYINYRFI